MLALQYFSKPVLLLVPALTKGQLHTSHSSACGKGQKTFLLQSSHPRHTQLICSPSTQLTNFTGGWESNENSLCCMFI